MLLLTAVPAARPDRRHPPAHPPRRPPAPQAYRKLSMQYHPDKHPGARQDLNAAAHP
jgi:hypothetical protein